MKKTTGNLPFEQQSAGKLLLTMCLPAVIIMVVMTVYHMTDLFFIGQLGDVTQLAAVSLVSPAIGIQSVFGTLIGGGGCAIIARRLGEKKGGEREIAGSCLLLSLASGGLYAAVLLAGIGQLLPLLGVSEQAAPFARQYLTIAAISTPAVVFSTAFGNIIRAEGAARQSMTANLLGTLTNILLDPLFILVFGMGVTGAALATALGNLLSALYLVCYLRSAKSRLAPTLTKHGCRTSLIPILTLGLPSALGNLLMNLAGGIQNRMLTGYGDQAIAAFSVGGKAAMVVAMVGMGIAIGIQPVLGYFWGAGNRQRLAGMLRASTITAVACTSLLGGCCLLFAPQLVHLFTTDPQTSELAIKVTRAALVTAPLLGGYYLSGNLLQAAGRALPATIASILRQGLVLIPVLLAAKLLGGLEGIVWSSAISDLLSSAAAILMTFSVYRHRFHRETASQPSFRLPTSVRPATATAIKQPFSARKDCASIQTAEK